MNLQPLRVEAGWEVCYNQLYEVDPVQGFESYFDSSSLLILRNQARLKFIDVEWRPYRDLDGEYRLQVLNFVENLHPKTNEFITDPDWEKPFLTFFTQSRSELVGKLEELMRVLPIYTDPRITSKRGVVSEPSETFRLRLKENGISSGLVTKILQKGNRQIQDLLLDHKDITRTILLEFSENGMSNKVKNKAKQKLNSKRFKE